MYRVTRELTFCYGHRLLDYDGKCRHLHGHNGKAVITLQADQLDERGMVRDFSEIKRALSSWIDEHIDHKMLLRRDDPVLPALQAAGEPVFVMESNPTAESIARLIFDVARAHGYPIVEVQLWETQNCYATYRGA
jgi:6-pyruvoyltetrahydropterin/6-carboxytetrahydropterin synthase